jgi:hypothetical protein
MSRFASAAAPPRRRLWPLFLIFGLVVALLIAWTGLWFHAAAQAKAEIAAWRERERQAGRQQDCASFAVGGFPFRIEVRCAGAGFELEGAPTTKLDLPAVLAMVQIYDPRLLISELTGPLNISERRGQTDYVVNWNVGRASVRGLPSAAERGSLVFDALSVRDPGTVGGDPVFRARHFELHGRQAFVSRAGNPAIETVLQLKDAMAERIHPVAARPIDAEVTGVLFGINDLSAKPWQLNAWPVMLKEWQARNGEIEITKARIRQDDVIAEGAGTLRLTPRGGLDGDLQVTVVGIEKMLSMFNIERVMSEGQIGATLNALDQLFPGLGGIARRSAGPGLAATLGRPTELDGKPATTLPVRFVDGTVFLGPVAVGAVPPLF